MGFLLRPEDALAPPGARLRWAPACPTELEVFSSARPPLDARHGHPHRTSLPRHRTIKEPSVSGSSLVVHDLPAQPGREHIRGPDCSQRCVFVDIGFPHSMLKTC